MADWGKIALLEARLAWHRRGLAWDLPYIHRYEAAYHTAHFWMLKHQREGRRQYAERNRRQMDAAGERCGKWRKAAHEHATEIARLEAALRVLRPKPKPPAPRGEGWSVPATSWNPYRRKIANWIIPELTWAHEHGWPGIITSGVRTYAEQQRLWEIYQHGGNIAARPGQSNHEGYDYPRGAIDTNNYSSLNAALDRKSGRRLLWAITHGLRDYVHFSGTGR